MFDLITELTYKDDLPSVNTINDIYFHTIVARFASRYVDSNAFSIMPVVTRLYELRFIYDMIAILPKPLLTALILYTRISISSPIAGPNAITPPAAICLLFFRLHASDSAPFRRRRIIISSHISPFYDVSAQDYIDLLFDYIFAVLYAERNDAYFAPIFTKFVEAIRF